jgi:hypothetical protein
MEICQKNAYYIRRSVLVSTTVKFPCCPPAAQYPYLLYNNMNYIPIHRFGYNYASAMQVGGYPKSRSK